MNDATQNLVKYSAGKSISRSLFLTDAAACHKKNPWEKELKT